MIKKRVFIFVLFISFSIHTQNKKQGIKNDGIISGTILDRKPSNHYPTLALHVRQRKTAY
jgi:hypothetical protein